MTTMKTIYPKTALCILALSGFALPLAAQEEQSESTLNRELTLEREYNPSVQDANKVNTLPAVKEPVITKMPIDYAILSMPADPKREIGLLPADHILSDMTYNKRRGYANAGIGTYMNINGDIGYHILSTDKNQLNIYFSHRSTNGEREYIEGFMKDEKVEARVNDNLGGMNFRHAFNNSTMHLGAKYGYTTFNYYGLPAPNAHNIWPGPVVDTETNQVSRMFTANAGIESKGIKPVGYLLDGDYTHFSYQYAWDESMKGITEHTLGARMKLYAMLGADKQVGVAAKFNYFFYHLPDSSASGFKNYLETTLTPYFRTEGDFWNLTLGANVMFITKTNGNTAKLFVSPHAGVDINTGAKTVIYLKAGGDIRSNSAYQLSRENRYIDPYMSATPSRTWLDAMAGVKSGLLPGFWFNLFGQYKVTDNDYFFVPYMSSEGFGNFSRVLSQDFRLLRGGVELKYAYRNLFELTLKGIYNHWNEEKDDTENSMGDGHSSLFKRKAYGRPTAELTASASIRPIRKLSLAFDYYLASGRQALINNARIVDMNDINELDFTAAYTFNDTFGAYIKMNNLLFKSYESIYGYPLQGFSIMGGININF
ncbi:MAG: TonB-dependent receptor [Tannerellaceae bacterium]|jgi:hypothetical protein|nr:TonB-dependent receptor [Tannerellaceae bacterium]